MLYNSFIFNYLTPKKVYLISNKIIAKQGDDNLLKEIQKDGYNMRVITSSASRDYITKSIAAYHIGR